MQVKTTDAAGNQATGRRSSPCAAAPAAAHGGGQSGGGSTPPPSGGGSSTDGGDLDEEPADGDDAEFEVSAPRKVKLAKGKLPITVTTDTPGKVSVALVRNGRIVARGSKSIAEGTATYKLKLPRKAKAGRYTLKVTFKPTGGEAITEKLTVKLTGKRKAGASTASVARAAGPRVGAGAPAGLPDGRFHGTRKRSFTPRAQARPSARRPALAGAPAVARRVSPAGRRRDI